jgi:hypothetical protein
MLYTQKLLTELEHKRDQFAGYQDRYGRQIRAYRDALASLGSRFATAARFRAVQDALLISDQGPLSIGAHPTAEYDRWQALPHASDALPALPFGKTFAHHEESRAWAECLRGVTTFAVDGSQLPPWRDASVPLALVQAGIFENPHSPPAPYLKDVTTELLPPDELLTADAEVADARSGEALSYSTQIVNLRRFELEVRTLIARMQHHAEQPVSAKGSDASRVVAFYDGSLIVSFALKMPPHYRDRYVAAARSLLAASETHRIPLIGYIDTSYARDILTMLSALENPGALPETRGLHDALLWQGNLHWGDRTPAFISARDDLARMGYDGQSVAFVYFQAAADRPPARLEFPHWLLDSGQLDAVLDIVRAEVIAGNGYPYPIEAADAVAVISAIDRAQFYALFQQFAEREGLSFSFSRKALSKTRRRV